MKRYFVNQSIVRRSIAALNDALRRDKIEVRFTGDINSKLDSLIVQKRVSQIIKQLEIQENCTHRFTEKADKDDISYCRYCYLCQ